MLSRKCSRSVALGRQSSIAVESERSLAQIWYGQWRTKDHGEVYGCNLLRYIVELVGVREDDAVLLRGQAEHGGEAEVTQALEVG